MSIPLTPVTSEIITAIGHDEPSHTLAIQFKVKHGSGQTYHYANFTREDYVAFAAAESIGKHFYKHIKDNPLKYPYTRQ